MLYSIEVRLQPETHEDKTWYFWILFGSKDGIRYNQGFGWENTIEAAARAAIKCYHSCQDEN